MAARTRLFDAELHRDLSGGLETDATISRVALTASKSCPSTRSERFIQTELREWAYARGYHHPYNWHRPGGRAAQTAVLRRAKAKRRKVHSR